MIKLLRNVLVFLLCSVCLPLLRAEDPVSDHSGNESHETETDKVEVDEAASHEAGYFLAPEETDALEDETGTSDVLSDDQLHFKLKSTLNKSHESAYVPIKSNDMEFQSLHRRVWLAFRLLDYVNAEKLYIELLTMNSSKEQKQQVYWELAEFYEETDQLLKSVSVWQHFLDTFPEDDNNPEIYIKLGMLYRHFGDYQLAIDSFFNVLKLSFLIKPEKINNYRDLSERAQFEIAETYYLIADYKLADEFFERVRRVSQDPKIRAEARVKKAYSNLLMGRYGTVINVMATFPMDYPNDPFVPNSRFLLATAYYKTDQKDKARREVYNLFARDVKPIDDPNWNYWLQRIGNQLANDFYSEGEYESAHTLYHALLPLHESPEWRWPIIFQVGLCVEGQRDFDKATEVYAELISLMDNFPSENNDKLNEERTLTLRNKVKRRLDQLIWEKEFEESVELLKQDNSHG